MISFEWDESKAKLNRKKHGISFQEAQSVFYDDLAIQFDDDSSEGEERFILLGISNLSRVLVVAHCERGPRGEVIRIISARKATAKEKKFYRGEQQ